MESKENGQKRPIKSLIVLYSYHHMNTEKVANAFAGVLKAQIKTPQQARPEELREYDLVGFGAGIDSGKHYKELLDFADKLPAVTDRKAFVFSTYGAPAFFGRFSDIDDMGRSQHVALKDKLRSKGYVVVDEFCCPGFNTNSFLKSFGGINKSRPNTEDLKRAESFARKLKLSLEN